MITKDFFPNPLDKLCILYILYMYSTNGGTSMELIIRNSTNQPIYDQIYCQIKSQILSGALAPGEALPSIRALAKDLKISVITTKRAYDELEAHGFIYTMAGKGCFVADNNLEILREQRRRELETHLTAALELAKSCGLTRQDLKQMLDLLSEEETT